MCFQVEPLQSNNPTAKFVYNARSTVISILNEELDSQAFKKNLSTLDKRIEIKCGDPATLSEIDEYGENMGNFDVEVQPFEHRLPIDDEGIKNNSCADKGHAIPDQDDEPTPEQTDQFTKMNVLLPRGEVYKRATILHSKRNRSGETIGRRNANPFLDTRVHESEFPEDEGVTIFSTTAATSLFDNCLYYGKDLMLFRSLLYHKSDMMSVQRVDAFMKRNGSNSESKKTTRGWKILVEFFDGTMKKEKLSDLKDSYPVQVSEYASGNRIIDEPTSSWWARYILNKRRSILSKV